MMFFKLTITLALILAATLEASAKVTYQKGFTPQKPGPANKHGFFVIGDKNSVKFRTLKNEAGHWSDAICGNVVQHSKGLGPHGSSYYTAPCEVNAAKGDQVVQVQCLNPKNPREKASGMATITWYKGPKQDGQRFYGIHVESIGNIWLGTSLASEASTPLIQGPFSLGGLKNEAVMINCNDNKRSKLSN